VTERIRPLLLSAAGLAVLGLILAAAANPRVFSKTSYLAALLLFEILVFCAWHYVRVFFPVLLLTFLWVGMRVPFREDARTARWVVLAMAAWIGFILWTSTRRKVHFGYFHVVALTCVVAALVSAAVSAVPSVAALKVLSLFLLFLYAASGARLAFQGHEEAFVQKLVLGCEIMTCFSAFCYLVLRFGVFGNPNALGAIMGVVIVPVLFWDVLVNQNKAVRYRRMALLLVASYLLYDSLSRASILAAAASTVLVCVALRRRLFLARIGFVVVFLLTAAGVLNPSRFDNFVNTATANMLYKGRESSTLFASRKGPWREAAWSIQKHPWFGSGFGTSDTLQGMADAASTYTTHGTTTEHGNSYLAIAEYTGLVGLVPFGLLVFLVGRKLVQIYVWMSRSALPSHAYIPLTMIVTAGLVHAFFEDWLFAAGFYLCVFFWSLAFSLMDFDPLTAKSSVQSLRWTMPGGTKIGMQSQASPPATGSPSSHRF
jgi:O-antigen ligase